ncbi:MAG: S8 family peptidase [Elainellaceae cyanobacterium]
MPDFVTQSRAGRAGVNVSLLKQRIVTQPQAALVRGDRLLPNDPLFDNQWHLLNRGQTGGTPGADANLEAAWDIALGTGVVIGIVDDGFQYTHPDLVGQYRPDLSFDFNDDDADPSPENSFDFHGTSVAGIAAASGQNGVGVSGSAPGASLAGIRLTAAPTTDTTEAQALSFRNQDIDIYNNSWGPSDDARRLEGPGPLTLAALRHGIATGRGGLGSIYVWAAGNGLQNGDNVNYDGYANSRYTIAVSAIDHNGKQAYYSEPGAPILVAAYSDGDDVGITTTDLVGSEGRDFDGDYTNEFGGTSSSAPLVSGVVALMLEVNPTLTWRDVQHILVETAKLTDPLDLDWTTNGAGHEINHQYGFGAVDAAAAVDAAISWIPVEPEMMTTTGRLPIGATIPDNRLTGIRSTVAIAKDITVEWAEVVFDATHPIRGDLKVTLTSPDGTESILADIHSDSNDDFESWTLTSARHWGESSAGNWTLTVADGFAGEIGTWDSWQLNLYGTAGDRLLGSSRNSPLVGGARGDGLNNYSSPLASTNSRLQTSGSKTGSNRGANAGSNITFTDVSEFSIYDSGISVPQSQGSPELNLLESVVSPSIQPSLLIEA